MRKTHGGSESLAQARWPVKVRPPKLKLDGKTNVAAVLGNYEPLGPTQTFLEARHDARHAFLPHFPNFLFLI